MKRVIWQSLRDLLIAFFAVFVFLCIQGAVDSRANAAQLSVAYKKGVIAGVMLARSDRYRTALCDRTTLIAEADR